MELSETVVGVPLWLMGVFCVFCVPAPYIISQQLFLILYLYAQLMQSLCDYIWSCLSSPSESREKQIHLSSRQLSDLTCTVRKQRVEYSCVYFAVKDFNAQFGLILFAAFALHVLSVANPVVNFIQETLTAMDPADISEGLCLVVLALTFNTVLFSPFIGVHGRVSVLSRNSYFTVL